MWRLTNFNLQLPSFRPVLTASLSIGITVSLSLPPGLIAQTQPSPTPTSGSNAPTGKTMEDYIAERGFYEPTGTYIADKIVENRANFDMVQVKIG